MVAMPVLHAIHDFLPRYAAGSGIYAFHLACELASRQVCRRPSCGGEHSDHCRKRYGPSKVSSPTSPRGALTNCNHAVNAVSDNEVPSLCLAAVVPSGIRTVDRANRSQGLS